MSSRRYVIAFFLYAILILSSCSDLPKTLQEKQRSILVTATAFISVAKQGPGNPTVGAWGDRITPGMNAIAVSADLVSLGLTRGTRVRIDGISDEYVVLDRMPPKWKKRIDLYMGSDVKAVRGRGKRDVMIIGRFPTNPNPDEEPKDFPVLPNFSSAAAICFG
jgi:3D (Asp-Asp-Asp) domain-containing protein